ncbi:site-2 protease family protein [Thalassobacillus hwangdonensis]|uniref:Site-2 protease family protein n=1 Tax=Thalassobacillus hwangdonensis TaxID=546108 RepID=A0ABW3L066_9BACI
MFDFFLAMLWIAPVGIMIHELGHGLAAISLKQTQAVVRIGSGKKLLSIVIGTVHIQIHAVFFFGGTTDSIRNTPFSKREEAWISVGGPVANLMLFSGLYIFLPGGHNGAIQLLMLFNLYLACFNLIPFKVNGKISDGYRVMQAIFPGLFK